MEKPAGKLATRVEEELRLTRTAQRERMNRPKMKQNTSQVRVFHETARYQSTSVLYTTQSYNRPLYETYFPNTKGETETNVRRKLGMTYLYPREEITTRGRESTRIIHRLPRLHHL